MKFMKYTLAAGICCTLSLGAVAASPYLFGTPTVEVTADKMVATTTQEVAHALQQVAFPVKQPHALPFNVGATSAFVRTLPAGVQAVEVTYSSTSTQGEQNHVPTYVSVTTINKPGVVQDQSNYSMTTVMLANGNSAHYLNNDTTQILSWSDQHQSYSIFAGKPNGVFTADDLAKIANSLK